MKLIDSIKFDLYRCAGRRDIRSFLHYYHYNEGFRYLFFHRLASKYSRWSVLGIVGRFNRRKLSYRFGFQIPLTVKIGRGLSIIHFGSVVINSKTVIGDNCNIYHGVTIGASFRGKTQGVPIIGDRVWIGTGSVIIGGVSIGNDVLIAPNSYVNFSIPSNSIALGNPARVIPKSDAIEGYILNVV